MSRDALESLELFPVVLRLRHRFRRVQEREAVLLRGPAGWGEFSPFPEYPPVVTARWLAAALESACGSLPTPKRDHVPVNVTVPAVGPEVAEALVRSSGCRTAKVKIAEPGQTEDEDLARLDAVRAALGDSGRMRVDVNGAWDVSTAVARIRRMAGYDLEYVEQPVPSLDDIARVKAETGVKVAVDESLRTATDPRRVAADAQVDVLVVKVQPLGGITRALELAQSSPVPVVVSSALETSIGIYPGVLAAACLDELPYDCGLGTLSLFEDDVVIERLEPVDGRVHVRRPSADPDLLVRHRPDNDRAAAMLRKVRAAAELLT